MNWFGWIWLLLALTGAAPALSQQGLGPEVLLEVVGAPDDGPRSVEIGEPFDVRVTVRHGREERPGLLELTGESAGYVLDRGPFTPEAGWVWFGGTDFRVTGRVPGTGELVSTAEFRVAALEPEWIDGEQGLAPLPTRALPPLTVIAQPVISQTVTGAGGGAEVRELLHATDVNVAVTSALQPGELEPRPPSGWPDLEPSLSVRAAWTRAGLMTLVSLAVLLLGARALIGGREDQELLSPLPSLEDRLGELRRKAEEDRAPRAAIERAYEMSALIREALGPSVGAPAVGAPLAGAAPASATDGEWLQLLKGSPLSPGELAELDRTFERLGRIKYAGEVPSAWASEELLEATGRWIARGEQLLSSKETEGIRPAQEASAGGVA